MAANVAVAEELKEKVEPFFVNCQQTMGGHVGIEFLRIEKGCIEASMPVDKRTHQPFGLLHGGASVVLAESLASFGAWVNIDEKKYAAVGMEINANHLRPVFSGFVYGRAEPIHIGSRSHVWQVKIRTADDKLVCVSRCTIAIIEQREES